MNNAEKFKQIFGLYAIELWSMPGGDFLEWLNRDVETTQIDHTADISKKVSIPCAHENDLIFRQAALDAIMGQPPEPHYPSWYAAQIKKLPAAQPDHNADASKKVTDEDCISRRVAIDALARMMPRSYTPDGSHPADEEIYKAQEIYADCIESIEILPAVQPEIIRCKDCKYMIDTGDDLMCDNAKGWVVATTSDFGCVLAERRTDDKTNKSSSC